MAIIIPDESIEDEEWWEIFGNDARIRQQNAAALRWAKDGEREREV